MTTRTFLRMPTAHVSACATRFARRHRKWIAEPSAQAPDVVRTSTAPPTAAHAAEDPDGTAEWIQQWQTFEHRHESASTRVSWSTRRIPGFGMVSLPLSAESSGAAEIAHVAGETRRWALLCDRSSRIADLGPDQDALRQAAADTAPQWEKYSDEDMDRLLDVCRWALENDTAGLSAREIPVPGIDTKWIEPRLKTIEAVVNAARIGHTTSGSELGLGLHTRDARVRLRILDAHISFPLRDVESPIREIAGLWNTGESPRHLVVVENLTTFLALPALPDTVALFGSGFAVDAVAAIPWALDANLVYWGDLDSHGFGILDRLRHHAPHATSVLMDNTTLDTWRRFSVSDPTPSRSYFALLTDEERATLDALTTGGDLLLEQERIPWDWAIPQLRSALGISD